MTKIEYLSQLNNRLRFMPDSDRIDAIEYYDGYFKDAENEEAAIKQLGTPEEVDANIWGSYSNKDNSVAPHDTGKRLGGGKGFKSAWIIILAIFALPIVLPIVISLVAVVFSLFFAVCSIIFSFGIAGLASVAAGIFGIMVSPFAFFQDFIQGILLIGMSLISLGIGILFIKLTIAMTRGFAYVTRFAYKKTRRASHGS